MIEDNFKIVAVLSGDDCPTEDFLNELQDADDPAGYGLLEILKHVASTGLDGIPRKWSHVENESEKIYAFIKGNFRLFYFKGVNGQIAVCTAGTRKSG